MGMFSNGWQRLWGGRGGQAALTAALEQLERRVADLEASQSRQAGKPWKDTLHIPSAALQRLPASEPFMPFSSCSTRDFFHPRFAELCALLREPVSLHRKIWEWIYVLNAAFSRGVVVPGNKALGFGVGREPIPAVFAAHGLGVLATDAPEEVGREQGWISTNQFAMEAERLFHEGIIDKEAFLRHVRFRVCDMNRIDADLTDFDFCWSSCCLEHLGSLQNGLDFIIATVERTLKVGGIACHTTELNLTSDQETVESGPTVLYRKRDLDGLVAELRHRGHAVDPVTVAPDTHYLDGYIDTPPFSSPPHLKLQLGRFASTSVGLIVQRGR